MKQTTILLTAILCILSASAASKSKPGDEQVLAAMKRATRYMYDKVSTQGGFVWNYTENLTHRWGELEAYPSMVWIEKGTPDMGQLMLDAYHATGDEYYYDMAVRSACILIRGQLPCGGWNYKFDLAGTASEQRWFSTIGRNAWGMGEHGHYYGNATFDDNVTASAFNFLMRIYIEKYDPQFKPALDKAVDMLFASQYPIGGWPQRWPLMYDHPDADGTPDYSACITLNDDVTANNIEILRCICFILGDARAVEPLMRAMNCVRILQQGAPAAGWADQYYADDLSPAKARDFEPAAVSTVRTRDCVRLLMEFYRLTGDRKFLAGIPAAIDFLKSVAFDQATQTAIGHKAGKGSIVCPRFIKPGTTTPLYMHRKGLHVNNGAYYCDQNPKNIIGHYASIVTINIDDLNRQFEQLKALPVEEATKDSPLKGEIQVEMLRYTPAVDKADTSKLPDVLASLDTDGRWIVRLDWVLVPYIGPGDPGAPIPDRYEETTGDRHNTATLVSDPIHGISTHAYLKNMATLIASLTKKQ